ncbi:hypothetical protein NI17_004385 [Thermobifida halotolerans]|uniref:DUF5753 domain-containing protein n=1 Tax=Thermobifida halotolerans TaxID=483545 RepID=A0AA97M4U5_9ACTN|nr:DUF5753 domain-containing protein [Thermobifida halotolerans]UOE20471.1 hypothetical protein NI17_004385 [Thermobifida halotolerans]
MAGQRQPHPGEEDTWPRFGSRLHAARERTGRLLDDLAETTVSSVYVLDEVEAGRMDPGRRIAAILDREFDAEGVLLDAWAHAHISDRLRVGSDIDGLWSEAFQIRAYAPLVVPEHFQTADYTRALDAAERPLEPHYVVTDRPHSRRLMATSSGPPYHCLVVDETALHRVVGTPEVLRAQLAHLHDLAQARYVTVHVIPTGTRQHPGLRGAFWTLSYSPRHSLAYLPHPRGRGHLVTDATHVKGYADLFATLQGAALSADASLALLADAAASVGEDRPRRALTAGTAPAPAPVPAADRDREPAR